MQDLQFYNNLTQASLSLGPLIQHCHYNPYQICRPILLYEVSDSNVCNYHGYSSAVQSGKDALLSCSCTRILKKSCIIVSIYHSQTEQNILPSTFEDEYHTQQFRKGEKFTLFSLGSLLTLGLYLTPAITLCNLTFCYRVNLKVLYDFHNKQRLFPCTQITDWIYNVHKSPIRYTQKTVVRIVYLRIQFG